MNHWYKFIIPLCALAFLLVSCAKRPASPVAAPGSPAPTEQSASSPVVSEPSAKILEARKNFDGNMLSGKHTVILHTSKGDVTMELDADAAPKTVTNFVVLARAGAYDNMMFHRVMPGFMIQGGDPNGDGTGGESIYGPVFEDEINAESYGLGEKTLKDAAEGEPLLPEFEKITIKEFYEKQGYVYKSELKSLPMTKGAVAMANRGPNTNGSQFFVIHGDSTPWLDGRHTVFGRVTEGMDVVDAITNVPRDSATDKPDEPVTFTVEVK